MEEGGGRFVNVLLTFICKIFIIAIPAFCVLYMYNNHTLYILIVSQTTCTVVFGRV